MKEILDDFFYENEAKDTVSAIIDRLFKIVYPSDKLKCCEHVMYRITFKMPKGFGGNPYIDYFWSNIIEEFKTVLLKEFGKGMMSKVSSTKVIPKQDIGFFSTNRHWRQTSYSKIIIDVKEITSPIIKLQNLLKDVYNKFYTSEYLNARPIEQSDWNVVKIKHHCTLAKCHKKQCTHDSCMKDCLFKQKIMELIENPGDDRIRIVMILVYQHLFDKTYNNFIFFK